MRLLPSGRHLKRLAIIAGLLIAVGLIVNAVMAWQTETQLADRIAAIRAGGDPTSIAELAPEPVPETDNAAAYLASVQADLAEFSKLYGEYYSAEEGKSLDQREDEGLPPTDKQVAAMGAILDKFPQIDIALEAAASCDRYASLLDFSLDHSPFLQALLENTQRVRTAVRFLDWRIKVDIAEGRHDDAVARGIELLRLARLYEQEPSMVQFLVGIAAREIAARSLYDALSAGPVAPELLVELNEEIARHDDPQRLVQMLKKERAISISGLDTLSMQVAPGAARAIGWPVKRYQIGVLDFYAEQLEIVARPWLEVQKQIRRAGAPRGDSGHGVMADLLAPAIRAAYEAYHRNVAVLRALRIYSALVQYRAEHGSQASGLSDLKLPEDLVRDPFSGEPLKLKRTEDGWLIYTVWQNGIDDGGDFTEMKDWGLGPAP
jgi:hypothetical protein